MPDWFDLVLESFWPLLRAGLLFTIPLTIMSFSLGLVLAFVVALIRLFGSKPLVAIVRFYVWLIRGTPLLVQLFVIFYGLPSVGIVLDPLPAALIGVCAHTRSLSTSLSHTTGMGAVGPPTSVSGAACNP